MIKFLIMGITIITFSEPKCIDDKPYWFVAMINDDTTIEWWQDVPLIRPETEVIK